MSLFSPELAY